MASARNFLFIVLIAGLLPVTGCMENSQELTKKAAELINIEHKFDDGQKLLEEAIEMDPDNAKAHKNLAYCLLKKKKTDEAMKHLLKAVEINENYGEAHINLSLIYYVKKDYKNAIKHMDLAVDCGFPVDLRYRNKLEPHRF